MPVLTPARKRGFTVVEVTIAIAIAGLIFSIVFIAIPRLQSGRRDNQRQRDAEALFGRIQEFESKTGRLPTGLEIGSAINSGSDAFAEYLPSTPFLSPSGNAYTFTNGWANFWASTDAMIASTPRLCEPDKESVNASTSGILVTTDPSDFYVAVRLERGYYCIDSDGL